MKAFERINEIIMTLSKERVGLTHAPELRELEGLVSKVEQCLDLNIHALAEAEANARALKMEVDDLKLQRGADQAALSQIQEEARKVKAEIDPIISNARRVFGGAPIEMKPDYRKATNDLSHAFNLLLKVMDDEPVKVSSLRAAIANAKQAQKLLK